MRKTRFVTILSLLTVTGLAFAGLGGQRSGTSIYNFLKIDPSANSGSMGGAFTAVGGDASVMHWNPAATVQLEGTNISMSHLNWFDDISYEYLAISQPYRSWSIGFEAGALHMDPMEITTEYNPYGSGEYFSYADYYFSLNVARKMSDRFSFGATGRLVREEYLDLASTSILMDLGTYYRTGFKDLVIAVAFLNFGSPAGPDGSYTAEDGSERDYEKYSPPTTFHIGTSMTLYENKSLDLLGSVQLNHPVDNSENYVMALRCTLFKTLALSAAYNIGIETMPFSMGIGLSADKWASGLRVDYAFRSHKYLKNVQQIQISYQF